MHKRSLREVLGLIDTIVYSKRAVIYARIDGRRAVDNKHRFRRGRTGKGLFWNETFRRCVTGIVTIAMVTQNLTFGGQITPGFASEPVDQPAASQAPFEEAGEATEGEERSESTQEAAGDKETEKGETSDEGAAVATKADPEQAPDQQAAPAITSLSVRSQVTESALASATEENNLQLDLGYEGLQAGAEYETTIELLDASTGDVLTTEPWTDEGGAQHTDPLEYRKNATSTEAAGTMHLDIEHVDLHWVAGKTLMLRVTLRTGGEQVVQRTFNGEEDARLYVPAIESVLHAADGSQELAAEEAAITIDSFSVRGLPADFETQVTGTLQVVDGDALAAEVTVITTGTDGAGVGDLNYPACDSRGFAGREIQSTVSVVVQWEPILLRKAACAKERLADVRGMLQSQQASRTGRLSMKVANPGMRDPRERTLTTRTETQTVLRMIPQTVKTPQQPRDLSRFLRRCPSKATRWPPSSRTMPARSRMPPYPAPILASWQ